MKPEDITENDRYYRHGESKVAHVVFDTHFQKPQDSGWDHHMIYTFCKSTFDYNEGHEKGSVWGSKEKVVVDGVLLCEMCDKAFEEAQAKGIRASGDSVGRGIDLLREVLKDKEK